MGLFIGQPKAFFDLLQELAADADKAKRKDDGEDYHTGRKFSHCHNHQGVQKNPRRA